MTLSVYIYIFVDVQLLPDLLSMVGCCTSCNAKINCDLDFS